MFLRGSPVAIASTKQRCRSIPAATTSTSPGTTSEHRVECPKSKVNPFVLVFVLSCRVLSEKFAHVTVLEAGRPLLFGVLVTRSGEGGMCPQLVASGVVFLRDLGCCVVAAAAADAFSGCGGRCV